MWTYISLTALTKLNISLAELSLILSTNTIVSLVCYSSRSCCLVLQVIFHSLVAFIRCCLPSEVMRGRVPFKDSSMECCLLSKAICNSQSSNQNRLSSHIIHKSFIHLPQSSFPHPQCSLDLPQVLSLPFSIVNVIYSLEFSWIISTIVGSIIFHSEISH